MRVSAFSAGIEAPIDRFNGTIHSIFHHACNIRLESGALLTLLSSEKTNVPQGIRLNTPLGFTFLNQARIDQPVGCRGGMLRISGSDLSADLRSAARWHLDLSRLRIDLHRHKVAHAWAAAWGEWETYRLENEMFTITEAVAPRHLNCAQLFDLTKLAKKGGLAIPALFVATRNFQVRETIDAMGILVGAGPGLTPSGDDFLVGYLAGLWSTTNHHTARLQFISSVGTWLAEAAISTNPISRTYIKSAVKGSVSEPLATLVHQLERANSLNTVRAATHTALHVGHTSGTDTVLGLLLGLIAWAMPPLPSMFALRRQSFLSVNLSARPHSYDHTPCLKPVSTKCIDP